MRISRILTKVFLGVFLFQISFSAFAGLGSDNTDSPNPTGGFGQNTTVTKNPNPVGGFGNGTNNPVPLGPPPPPPEPVPLDGGVVLLVISALGLGVRKLYQETKIK